MNNSAVKVTVADAFVFTVGAVLQLHPKPGMNKFSYDIFIKATFKELKLEKLANKPNIVIVATEKKQEKKRLEAHY